MRKAVSCLFAASLVLSSYAINNNDKEYYLAEEHIKNLPEAPKGYKWVVNEDYTDEFNGRRLSASKWHAKSPYWTNGRPPATFKVHIPADTRSAFPVISVQSPVSIQCCWQS